MRDQEDIWRKIDAAFAIGALALAVATGIIMTISIIAWMLGV